MTSESFSGAIPRSLLHTPFDLFQTPSLVLTFFFKCLPLADFHREMEQGQVTKWPEFQQDMCSVSAGTQGPLAQWEAKCIMQGSRPWGPLLHPGMLPLAILGKEIGVQISLDIFFLENSFLGIRDKNLEHCYPGYLLRKIFFEYTLGSPARQKY